MRTFVLSNNNGNMEQQQGDENLEKPKRRRRRNLEEINQALSKAITEIICEQGFGKPMINHVSERANVIKRVIYENYESFDAVLKQYFAQNDFWTPLILSKIADKCPDYKDFFTNVLKEFYNAIDNNATFQCIVRWEIACPDDFVRKQARGREKDCSEELQKNVKFFQQMGIDIEAFYALLIAGIYYLVLRKDVSTFCNINVATRAGKERIFNAIDKLADLMFSAVERMEEKKRIARRLLGRGMMPEEVAEILEVDTAFVSSVVETGEGNSQA